MYNPVRFISLNSPIYSSFNYVRHAAERDVSTIQTSSVCHVTNMNGRVKQSASIQIYYL